MAATFLTSAFDGTVDMTAAIFSRLSLSTGSKGFEGLMGVTLAVGVCGRIANDHEGINHVNTGRISTAIRDILSNQCRKLADACCISRKPTKVISKIHVVFNEA